MSLSTKELKLAAIILDYPGDQELKTVLSNINGSVLKLLSGIFIIHTSKDLSISKEELKSIKDEFNVKLAYLDIPRNKYGLGMKSGFCWALENNFDIVFTLEGHGKFDTRVLPEMINALLNNQAAMVIGSRFFNSVGALDKLKASYRFFGNKLLTQFGRSLTDIKITDWHSGFRVISVDALKKIPFSVNSDSFNFDFELLLQFREMGLKLTEVPTGFYKGDNMTFLDGVIFARDVVVDVIRYRAHKIGFGTGLTAFNSLAYELKDDERSSHGTIVKIMSSLPPGEVLDVGCSEGSLGARLREFGHVVTGIDIVKQNNVDENLDNFILYDLEAGLPKDLNKTFDYIVMADVLEHLKAPEELLKQSKSLLSQQGKMIISVPNVGHWYARLKIGLGLFDYDRRGIFDRGHLRFFTKISFRRLLESCGLAIVEVKAVGLPLDIFKRASSGKLSGSRVANDFKKVIQLIQTLLLKIYPELFGYQFIFLVEKPSANLQASQYVDI